MSNLAHPDGDDFPAAAAKHLDDAVALFAANRTDGAGYLAGYVRECSLKAVIVVDAIGRNVRLAPGTTLAALLCSASPADQEAVDAGRTMGHKEAIKSRHDLGKLSIEALRLAGIPGAAVVKYTSCLAASSALQKDKWRETIRYCAAGTISLPQASLWLDDAKAVYLGTVGEMRRDGVVF